MSDQCNVIGCVAAEERGYAGMTGTYRMISFRVRRQKTGRKKFLGIEKRGHVGTHWNFSSYSGDVAFATSTFRSRSPRHPMT